MGREREDVCHSDMEDGERLEEDDNLEEEANADLSLSILAKLKSRRPPVSPCRSPSSPFLGGQAQLEDDLGLPSLLTGEVGNLAGNVASEDGQIVNEEAAVPEPSASVPPNGKRRKRKKKAAGVVTQSELILENTETVSVEATTDGGKFKDAKTPSPATDPSEPLTAEAASSIAMRKLLRGPRYFDPPEEWQKTCYNCNNVGHLAIDCPEVPRSKPCYVCGKFGHVGRECPQSSECYICGESGHFAKTCPQKCKVAVNQQADSICFRCGDIGHDAAVCWKDYSVEDLKAIRCYVCKQQGHLCCVDVVAMSHTEVSCYNCGEIGHTGMGCAKSRGPSKNSEKPAPLCYKCGEEGHFARGCSKRDQGLYDNPFGRDEPEDRWTQTPSGLLNMGTTPKQLVRLNQNDFLKDFASTGGARSKRKGLRTNEQEDFIHRNKRRYENQPYQVQRWYEETPHEKNISLPRWFTLASSSHENAGYANARYSNENFRAPSHKRWRT